MEKITTTGLDLVNVPRFTTRPPMHFVSIKTRGDQAACIVLKTRELFVRQRSQTERPTCTHGRDGHHRSSRKDQHRHGAETM